MQTTHFKKFNEKRMESSRCCSGRRTNTNSWRRYLSSSFNIVLIFVCFLKLIIYANCTGAAWSKPNAWSEIDFGTGRALHVWETSANNAYSLLYGGIGTNGYVTTDTYILWHGGSKQFGKDIEQPFWEILPGVAPSPGKRFAAAASAVGENEILMFGGSFKYKYLSDTWIFNGEKKNWRRAGLLSSAPVPGLKYAQIARISNNILIMFGGIRDETSFETATWKFSYDNDAWEKIEGSNNIPPLREYHRMIWTNVGPLVFGGRKGNIYYNDCWLYSEPDGWKEIKPENNDTLWPSATVSMSMDSNIDGTKIVMVGGNGPETENSKMTWIFSTATKTWEQILPPESSSSEHFFVNRGNLAFLSPNGFVLIGGFYNSHFINYPRVFDLEQKLWKKANSIDTLPPKLKKHVSTEIVGTDCVLIHGGIIGNSLVYYQYAWKYCSDKKSWQFLNMAQDSENPGPRISHGMVSFTPRKGIMFGGYHQNKFFDTTYIFTLPYNGYITWRKINSDYGPSKRSGFGMALIKRPDNVPSKSIACLFGGTSEGGRVNHGDTWCFDGSTNKWTEMVAADKVKPLSRHQVGIASYSTNKMLIFGGQGTTTSGPAIFNDLWEFNYEKQQWRALTALAKINSGNVIPEKRYLPLLARLQTFNAFVLFGGKNTVPLSDTWMLWFDLDGQPYWKLLTLPISPPASLYASISSIDVPVEKIYPAPTNPDVVTFGGPEVVIFGGELLWNINSDTTTVFVNSECPPGTQAINRIKSNGCELCPIGFYKESAQVGCTSCLKGISTTRRRGSERKSDCAICEKHKDSAGVCALEESDDIKRGTKQVWSCFSGVWGGQCQYRCPGFEESKAGGKQTNVCGQKFSGVCSEGPDGTGKCKCSWGYSNIFSEDVNCIFPMGYILCIIALCLIIASCYQIFTYRKKQQIILSELNEKENLLLQKDIELREEKISVQKAQEGWKIQEGEIIMSKKIGKGSFSNVYVGTWSPLKNVPVAIKVMNDQNATIFDDSETLLLQRLRHPRLVLFFGTGILKKENKVFLVSEYMSGGDLMNFIKKAASSGDYEAMYPWKKRVKDAMDIAEGMNFLHSQEWVHRDLKSANILIHSNGQCKITDFGLSKSLQEISKEKQTVYNNNMKKKKEVVISVTKDDEKLLRSESSSSFSTEDAYKSIEMTSFAGSAPWLAPELITKRSKDVATGGKPVDVYSFACVLYELVEGRIPWSTASSREDIFQRVESGSRPTLTPIKHDNLTMHDGIGIHVNKSIHRLMISCWDHIPSKRPTFSNVIEELATIYHDNFIEKQQMTNRRENSIADDKSYAANSLSIPLLKSV
jgi:serine/threonine protein kinase